MDIKSVGLIILTYMVLYGVLASLYVVVACFIDRCWHIPLEKISKDVKDVRKIIEMEPPEWQAQVYSRGWMTHHEWRKVLKRQLTAIEAELQRRGINSNGFVAQTNNSPSFPYPRGAYATVGATIVLGLPSAVKRLSKPTRTCTSTT